MKILDEAKILNSKITHVRQQMDSKEIFPGVILK